MDFTGGKYLHLHNDFTKGYSHGTVQMTKSEHCARWWNGTKYNRCQGFNLTNNDTALRWRHNNAMASQITSLTIVYPTVYSGADQRKHQSSASLAFVQGESPHKGSVTWKMFPLDDVILSHVTRTPFKTNSRTLLSLVHTCSMLSSFMIQSYNKHWIVLQITSIE